MLFFQASFTSETIKLQIGISVSNEGAVIRWNTISRYLNAKNKFIEQSSNLWATQLYDFRPFSLKSHFFLIDPARVHFVWQCCYFLFSVDIGNVALYVDVQLL